MKVLDCYRGRTRRVRVYWRCVFVDPMALAHGVYGDNAAHANVSGGDGSERRAGEHSMKVKKEQELVFGTGKEVVDAKTVSIRLSVLAKKAMPMTAIFSIACASSLVLAKERQRVFIQELYLHWLARSTSPCVVYIPIQKSNALGIRIFVLLSSSAHPEAAGRLPAKLQLRS